MIPLVVADVGKEYIIRKVGGNAEVRRHLENLGFVAGDAATVVADVSGNVIVNIKGARIAISKEMAMKIMV
ncbi:MAG: ferrous iron transport protein A [Oscillospiraceae bacterium]|nr:ferrous iron transport protein A [Oscillospiraceae bacterium]